MVKICMQCGKENPEHYETCQQCNALLIKEDVGQGFPIQNKNKEE